MSLKLMLVQRIVPWPSLNVLYLGLEYSWAGQMLTSSRCHCLRNCSMRVSRSSLPRHDRYMHTSAVVPVL